MNVEIVSDWLVLDGKFIYRMKDVYELGIDKSSSNNEIIELIKEKIKKEKGENNETNHA